MGIKQNRIGVTIGTENAYSKGLNAAKKDFKGFNNEISAGFMGSAKTVAVAAAVVTTTLFAMKKAYDLAHESAKFEDTARAFENLSTSHGVASAAIIEDLREMSAQTISTADLMKTAGSAMVLGIPADKLSQMMQVARASSRITGQTMQKSFADISLGMARGSRLILDNLGIIVKLEDAYKTFAREQDINVKNLTDQQKKQAFYNATLRSGQDIIESVGVTGLTSAEKFDRFNAQLSDFAIALGEKVLPAAESFLDIMNKIIGAPLKVEDATTRLKTLKDELVKYQSIQALNAASLNAELDRNYNAYRRNANIAKLQAVQPKVAFIIAKLKTQIRLDEEKITKEKTKQVELAKAIKEAKADEKQEAADAAAAKKAATAKAAALKAAATTINTLRIATAKLGATEEEIIKIDAAEFESRGASAAQVIEYTRLLEQMRKKKKEIADQTEADRQSDAAAKGLAGLGEAPGVQTGAGTPQQFAEFEQMQTRLQAIQDFHAEKITLMAAAGATEQQLLAEQHAGEIAQEKQKHRMKLALAQGTFGMMSNMMQNLTVLTGKEGGAAFKAMKVFAIAEALVKAKQSVVDSYEAGSKLGGPALGAAFAAAAGIATAAQIKQIASIEPGGGATGTTISPGGTANPPYSGGSPSAYPVPERIDQTRERPTIIFKVEKIELLGDDSVDRLMERISDRVKDFDVELIATETVTV